MNDSRDTSSPLERILTALRDGDQSVGQAADLIRVLAARGSLSDASSAETGDAVVDLDRQQRCGFPEVVFSEGKSADSVARIMSALLTAKQHAFATRISEEQVQAVLNSIGRSRESQQVHFNPLARTLRIDADAERWKGDRVAVVSAGTTDQPVAEEAAETLRWMGAAVETIVDVGVAGPQRLARRLLDLRDTAAIVVVAGMEGALPSVVGGFVSAPVIAVPTSVGYGANLGGVAALLSMLNSCAANVTVVNIDAGFKAGFVAGLIATQSVRQGHRS